MTVRLRFLGSGDAFGSGGRMQTCILADDGERRCLIDCGMTSLSALKGQGLDPNSVDAILLTHLHGDHFGGVPLFVLDALVASNRKRPLTVAGPEGTEERVRRAGEALFAGMWERQALFDLTFLEMTPETRHEVMGMGVTPYPVVHSPDVNPTALRVEIGGKVVAYTGDTGWTDRLPEVARDADLLIAECYWFVPRTPNHLDYRTLSERLPHLGARRTILTHLGPEMLAHLQRVTLDYATDGRVVEIG
ncbi:MAG: MBL fold metallo-hydrolase [Magnetospirillum sp. WYHS-4]